MRRCLAVLSLLAVTSCGSEPVAAPSPAPPSPLGVDVLPLGREVLSLDTGRWRSPETFLPPLSVVVTGAGWQSMHRFADMFDVTRPEPGRPVPRLAVVFSIGPGTDADAVVRDVTVRMGAAATATARGRLGSLPATVFDVVGGAGEAYRSTTGGFGLYGERGQRVRFWVATSGTAVLVATAIVPDAKAHWTVEVARAAAVVASVRAG